MGVVILCGVLFGTILGRFFKIFILVPASALAVVLVLASSTNSETTLWGLVLQIGVLVTSLQIGYLVGLVTSTSPLLEGAWKSWGHRATPTTSRSYHIR